MILSIQHDFQAIIWQFYADHKRFFAWRHVDDAYKVLISEVMLQQTQTHRVMSKYEQFITVFPDFYSLANANLPELLACWQGLGYNRRALYVQKIAQMVLRDFNGRLPADPAVLQTFPGLGAATAASVCVFSYDMPLPFIETNIRTVFIHEFFQGQSGIHDRQLMPLIQATLDHSAPRDWFYALMDYGVMLKRLYPNPSRKSVHHHKQSKFEGSDRQVRGAVLRLLLQQKQVALENVPAVLGEDAVRVHKILEQLQKDGFVVIETSGVRLA
jgi:A/G-specific adenine glycosylase